jgi:hypothetical protein
LLDNAPAHAGENAPKSDNGKLFVKYLPPNVTILVQPMDQRVTATMNRCNRRIILQNHSDEGSDLDIFWKRLSLLDAI